MSKFETIEYEDLTPLLDLGVNFFDISTQGYGYKIDGLFFMPFFIMELNRIKYCFMLSDESSFTINVFENELQSFLFEMRYLGYDL